MTLLIVSSEISIARYILRTEFLPHLLSRGVKIIIAAPAEEAEKYEEEFGGPQVAVTPVSRAKQTAGEKLSFFFSRNTFPSRTVSWVQKEQYYLDRNLPMYVLRVALRVGLGFFPMTPAIFRFFERRLKEDPETASMFDKYNPDAVLSTVLFREMDVRFSRSAKKRNIPLIGMVRSWDNLTTYGYIRVVPDAFLAQSEFIADMACRYQKFPGRAIKIVGTPLYDIYVKKDILWTREKLLSHYGLLPGSKIALYAAVGTFLFPKEEALLNLFAEILDEGGESMKDLHFIYRAHPSFPMGGDLASRHKKVLVDRPGSPAIGFSGRYFMLSRDEEILVNTLYHVDLVITPASTVALDAMIFSKPVIVLAFDPAPPPAFARSVKAFQKYLTHFRDMLNCGGAENVFSRKEFKESIVSNLRDPSRNSRGRECIRKRFLDPLDGKSSLRLARAVEDFLKSHAPA